MLVQLLFNKKEKIKQKSKSNYFRATNWLNVIQFLLLLNNKKTFFLCNLKKKNSSFNLYFARNLFMQEENNPNQLREKKFPFPSLQSNFPIFKMSCQFSSLRRLAEKFFFFLFCHTNKRLEWEDHVEECLENKNSLSSIELESWEFYKCRIYLHSNKHTAERRLRVIFKLETVISFYISICLNSRHFSSSLHW